MRLDVPWKHHAPCLHLTSCELAHHGGSRWLLSKYLKWIDFLFFTFLPVLNYLGWWWDMNLNFGAQKSRGERVLGWKWRAPIWDFTYLYVCGCFGCMCVCVLHAWHAVPLEDRWDCEIPGTRVRCTCEPPCVCWGLNPGLLKSSQCSPLRCCSSNGCWFEESMMEATIWAKTKIHTQHPTLLLISHHPTTLFLQVSLFLRYHSLLICLIWCVRLMVVTLYLDARFNPWWQSLLRKQLDSGSHSILVLEKCAGNLCCVSGKGLLLKGKSWHSLASSLGWTLQLVSIQEVSDYTLPWTSDKKHEGSLGCFFFRVRSASANPPTLWDSPGCFSPMSCYVLSETDKAWVIIWDG